MMSNAGSWDSSPQNFYRMMVETLRLLAAPAEMQVTLFPSFVDIPGEVAQLSDDVCYLLEQIRVAGLVSATQEAEFRAISKLFNEMADDGPAGLWTIDAMEKAPEWSAIRERSQLLLVNLGKCSRAPNLYWFAFHQLDTDSARKFARALPELEKLADLQNDDKEQE